jgi:hypothetical protein
MDYVAIMDEGSISHLGTFNELEQQILKKSGLKHFDEAHKNEIEEEELDFN